MRSVAELELSSNFGPLLEDFLPKLNLQRRYDVENSNGFDIENGNELGTPCGNLKMTWFAKDSLNWNLSKKWTFILVRSIFLGFR